MAQSNEIRVVAYTMAQQLEIFYRHELQDGNDIPPAVRVFIQRADGALYPLDATLVVMYTNDK
jgi:hypothetical protein